MTHELTVLIGPPAVAATMVDVLSDWSASGIVDPVVVVDESALRPGDFRIPAHVIVGGISEATSMQSYLADRVGFTRARVVAVGRLRATAESPSAGIATLVVGELRRTLPSVSIVQAQVIGATLLGGQLPAEVAWLGWHNIVVAPEDSLAPGAGVERLASDANRGLLDTHLLTSVCTVAGAWAHAQGSPLDDLQPLPGNQVTLFRSFTRLLSAHRVEDELLSRLTSVDGGYPLPQVGSEQAWAVEDELAAARTMSGQLLAKHHYVLPHQRVIPPRAAAKDLGVIDAFKMLWGFLWAALRNAPRAWVEAVVHRTAARIAGTAQRAVFGADDAEYEIVVRGVRGDGTPASWADIDQSTAALSSRIGPAGSAQAAGIDLSAFWKDFVGGALTLLDGETRTPELPAVAVGAHRGIVTNPARVVPDPRDVFEPTGAVAANVKGWRVEPADQIQARALEGELERVAHTNTMLRTAATEDRTRVQEWRAHAERSYTGQVGTELGRAVVSTRREVTELAEQLAAADRAMELPDDIEGSQRAVARKLRWIFFGALVAVVATVVVVLLDVLAPLIGVIVSAVVLVVWLVTSVVVFMNGQRRLFALLHARKELAGRAEVLREFLVAAIADLRRLVRAYRQYIEWSRALGTFVAAPNGRLAEEQQEDIALGAGLPRSIAFGEVQPEQAVLDDVAARLRNEILKVGWLSASWDAFLADVPEQLGPRAYEIREQPDAIWVDQGSSDRSILTAWSRCVADRGVAAGAVQDLRERVRATLVAHPAGLVEQLSASIRTRGTTGELRTVSYREFIAGLRDLSGVQHVFDQSVFTHLGAAGEPWRIDPSSTWSASGAADLGGSVVVAQRSRGIAMTDLVFAAAPRAVGSDADRQSDLPPPPPQHPVM